MTIFEASPEEYQNRRLHTIALMAATIMVNRGDGYYSTTAAEEAIQLFDTVDRLTANKALNPHRPLER